MICNVPGSWCSPSSVVHSHTETVSLCDQQRMLEVMACHSWDSVIKDCSFSPGFSPPLPPLLSPAPTFSHHSLGEAKEMLWRYLCSEKLKPFANKRTWKQFALVNSSKTEPGRQLKHNLLRDYASESSWHCSQVPDPQKQCKIMFVLVRCKYVAN